MSSSFATTLSDAKVDALQKVVSNGRVKYLCFTKCTDSESWVINVTDGIDLWLLELDVHGLEAQKDLSGIDSIEAFLIRFRNGFQSGEVTVGRIGTKVTLSVGKGASAIELDLFEAKAAEKKLELQSVLFSLAECCSRLEVQLTAASQQIETLKAQKNQAGGLNPFMDASPKKGAGQNKAKVRKVGMSVINPSSRRKKAATGVVFEGN
ncbi:unnamed protein product [Candidula unifasciata]|uniref:Uncharacterized protein n=1 Tax=Candidula unifasciata TaxID=100452 RepID=A0A8S3ZLY6_9EUPU|nr:unnamed protein product [Candidula unifasciata]